MLIPVVGNPVKQPHPFPAIDSKIHGRQADGTHTQTALEEDRMFVLDEGTRFVIPRTEMTYPGHSMKLHRNAADPVKSPVDHVIDGF